MQTVLNPPRSYAAAWLKCKNAKRLLLFISEFTVKAERTSYQNKRKSGLFAMLMKVLSVCCAFIDKFFLQAYNEAIK